MQPTVWVWVCVGSLQGATTRCCLARACEACAGGAHARVMRKGCARHRATPEVCVRSSLPSHNPQPPTQESERGRGHASLGARPLIRACACDLRACAHANMAASHTLTCAARVRQACMPLRLAVRPAQATTTPAHSSNNTANRGASLRMHAPGVRRRRPCARRRCWSDVTTCTGAQHTAHALPSLTPLLGIAAHVCMHQISVSRGGCMATHTHSHKLIHTSNTHIKHTTCTPQTHTHTARKAHTCLRACAASRCSWAHPAWRPVQGLRARCSAPAAQWAHRGWPRLFVRVCACVHVHVHVHVHVCVRACAGVGVCVCMHVRAWAQLSLH
jgi:hypothetical protein